MNFFAKVTPEESGISSRNIIDFVEAMCQGEKDQETHSFLLLRHGKLVFEGYFAPYTQETEHMEYSVSKSFTSIAIGFLADEGKLSVDDYIYTYFPELIKDDINKENLKIKIHDLLSMSFGQQGGAVHESQKRKDMSTAMLYDFFYRGKDLDCGQMFRYDSYGTYMLAALVKQITGENVVEYLMPRLFDPLNIPKPYYVKDDIGINIGYSGMRLKLRDLAKVGQVYLDGGVWEDKQLIPANWVKLATQKHISTTNCNTGLDWQEGYCYQFWKGRYNTTRLCGAYGQMCVIMPDYDAVFVINSGYDNNKLGYILESFYENIMFNMKDSPLPEDKEAYAKLNDVLSGLCLTFEFSDMSPMAGIISGNTYSLTNATAYTDAKFDFGKEEVKVTLISDKSSFEFTAGFNKPVFSKAQGTYFCVPGREDDTLIAATAVWHTKKDMEITLRFIGSPSIVKIIADFSKEPRVELVGIRSRV